MQPSDPFGNAGDHEAGDTSTHVLASTTPKKAQSPNGMRLPAQHYEHLFRSHYHQLRVRAQQITGSRVEAEGVVQKVFAEVWARRETLQIGSLKPYLYQAVKSRALDAVRRLNNRRKHVVGSVESLVQERSPSSQTVGSDPARVLEARQLSEAVEQAVEALPGRRRQVYLMSRQEGQSNGDIAETLDISKRTVEMHLWRALRDLREAIASFLPEGSPYLTVMLVLAVRLLTSIT